MKDVSSLYPKRMLENKSNINKYDIEKILVLRKALSNYLSFIPFSLWGAIGDENE